MFSLVRIKRLFPATPKAMVVLIATEIPELFGRFGIMTTIALYLTKNLHQTDATSFIVFSTYLMLAAITPMIGGVIADRLLGYKKAIIVGSILMILGNLIMVVPHMMMLYVGLGILVAGTGLFSPSLAALVSHLYPDQDKGRDSAFIAYYVAKNIGALLAPPLCGFIGVYFGYHYSFLLTAVGMMVGLLVFVNGQQYLPNVKLKNVINKMPFFNRFTGLLKGRENITAIVIMAGVSILAFMVFVFNARYFLLTICCVATVLLFTYLYRVSDHNKRAELGVIVLTIFTVIAFLSMNHLCGASFNLFVERIVDRRVFGVIFPTSVFYAIDPLFMLLFGALIAKALSRLRRQNYIVACFTKFTLAMFLFTLAMFFFVMASAQGMVLGSASNYFVLLCYAVCATSELCIVPIALSLITRLAPLGQTGLAVGLFSVSDVIASFFTGMIASHGAIPFAVHSLHTRKIASSIYHTLFLHLDIVLLIVSITIMLVTFILASHMKRQRLALAPLMI